MSLLERITEKALRAAGATEVRQYSAAKNNRLVGDRLNSNSSANQDIRDSIRQLRANARQLARDNDYFVGYLKKLLVNVIGTDGLKLQANAKKATGEVKEEINRKVESAWKKWSLKTNCDVTGQSSLRDLAGLALRTLATEGEFLGRYIFDPNTEFGLKLQLLDVDWLDEDYNDDGRGNGNRIIMSVELDPYDRPVAYWFTDPRWSTVSVPGIKVVPQNVRRLRIPADQVIHRFIKERPGQVRGVTWGHSSMLTLNQMDGFDEAELVAARINASNMAFVSPPAPTDSNFGTPATGDISTEVAPGQILEIPAGYTVHEFSPNKPQDESFGKRILRKIAVGLGISNSTLTGDLTDVNFSSIRAGTIDERDVWRSAQKWMAEHFYQDIYEKWLMFNANLVPATALEQVFYPIWRGRGFEWVDPSKDINADIAAINRGLKTIAEVVESRGQDFEEVMEQHAYEKAFIEKLGLQFASPDLQAQLAADQADAAANNAEDKDKPKGKEKK